MAWVIEVLVGVPMFTRTVGMTMPMVMVMVVGMWM